MNETTAIPAADRAQNKVLWKNPSFTLMWTSTAASGFGDRMIMLAALALLGGLAMEADSSSIQASTQFFFFLPYLIFNIFGGWLADRLPRKYMLMACDESRGLLLLGTYFYLGTMTGGSAIDPNQHWRVWAMLAAIGCFAAIFNPTRNAIVPQIVRYSQLQPANACILVINVVASMVGMVIGGMIISGADISTVRLGLLLGALFYLISGTFFAFMKPTDSVVTEKPHAARSLRQASRYCRDHRRVIHLIAVNVLVWASAAIVSTGVMGLVKIHHGMAGDALLQQYTQLAAIMGGGMLVGAGFVVMVGTMRESTILLSVGLGLAGACVFILAAVPWMPVSYVACFGVGFFGNIAIISAITLLQAITPNYMRGRVMGLNSMVNTIFSISIYFIIWKMPNADWWVVIIMLVLGPTLLITGIVSLTRNLMSGPMPNRGANVCWRVTRLFCFSHHKLKINGKHHVPADGPTLIVANHTTAMDPFLIQCCTNRMVRWLMLTSFRYKIGNFLWNAIDPICLEHDKATGESASGSAQVRQIVRELKKGDLVGMFPEGHLQYDNRIVKPFEPGAAVMAKLAKATIVPCWVEGTALSKSMLVHVLKPSRSTITFGPAFTVDPKASPETSTTLIRERVMDAARRGAHAGAECKYCGYSLRGLFDRENNTCPECGAAVLALPDFDATPVKT